MFSRDVSPSVAIPQLPLAPPTLTRQRTRSFQLSESDSSDSDTDSPEVVDLWNSYVSGMTSRTQTTSSGRVSRPPRRLTANDVYQAACQPADPTDSDEDEDISTLEVKYEQDVLPDSDDEDFINNEEEEEVDPTLLNDDDESSLTEQSDTDEDSLH
jgi:hypothetical protein